MSDQRVTIMLAAELSRLETRNAHLSHLVVILADAAHASPEERNTLDRLLRLLDEL